MKAKQMLQLLKMSYEVTTNHPILLITTLLLMTGIYFPLTLPSLVALCLELISIGWYGARVAFIEKAFDGQDVSFNYVLKKSKFFFRKLLPIALVYNFCLMIFVSLLILSYLQWFFAHQTKIENLVALQNRSNFANFFREALDPGAINSFTTENPITFSLVVIYQAIGVINVIVGSTFISLLVVKKEGVRKTFNETFHFLFKHLGFLVVLVIFQILLRQFLGFFSDLFDQYLLTEVRDIYYWMAVFFTKIELIISVYIYLVFQAFVLGYVNKTNKKG